VITDRAAAAAQMEASELQYSPFSGLTISDMARLGKDKRFIVSTKGNEGNARTNTIEFNFRRTELSDIRVRRAITHAINVPFFIDTSSAISPSWAPADSLDLDRLLSGRRYAAIPLRQGQGSRTAQ
jgi:ABC-type transport system substrate-binding protein